MSKDNKVNIRLEVFKDRNSGKLSITAHFDQNAPNIFKDKDGYIWMPNEEEKDLINEAFELIPFDDLSSSQTTNFEKFKDEKVMQTPRQEIKFDKEKPIIAPTLNKEPVVFKSNSSENENKFDKNMDNEERYIKEKYQGHNEKEPNELEEKESVRDEDEGFIVEADESAINAALKKHVEKDKAFVEADEQTIIEKVLNQKKKGKWTRK